MELAAVYTLTVVVFLALDAIMLKFVMRPLFSEHIGDWLLDDVRLLPAVGFYLFYVAGIVWFVSMPALKSGVTSHALFAGAFLGAIAYGTYEFTNYATLKNWSPSMVAVDVIWGTVLTGLSAWAGVAAVKAVL
ncbi:MAG TPA: DUF2177 family protein [Paracoccaceae bacterium]|nr:DUF2177 family protein [Paracoccaceae bacterium]